MIDVEERENVKVIIGDLQGLADWFIGTDNIAYVDFQHLDDWERDKEVIIRSRD